MGQNALKPIIIFISACFFLSACSQQVRQIYFFHLGERNTDYRLSPQFCLAGDSLSAKQELDFKAPVMFELNQKQLNSVFAEISDQQKARTNIVDSVIDVRTANMHFGSIFPVYIVAKTKDNVELSHSLIKDEEEYILLLNKLKESVKDSVVYEFVTYEEKMIETE